MTEPALLIERDGHIVTLTMNRPEVKNAINMEMLCRLADAWEMIDDDPDVRCAILTGAGSDFCAGADLDKLVARSMQNLPPEDEFEARIRADYGVIFEGLLRNRQLKKPLIAAVEGYCVAGGTEILQATDIRVAGEGSTFGITEAKWSLYPQGGSRDPAAPPDPVHEGDGDAADGGHVSGRGGAELRADRPHRAEGPGAGGRARNSPRRSRRTARSRSSRSRKPCSAPSACRSRMRSRSICRSACR